MPPLPLICSSIGAVALAFAGCATAPVSQEPANLDPLKQQIRSYVDGGQYQRDIEAVAARARAWVEGRAAKGGVKLTMIFDLDETLISNLPLFQRQDFGFVRSEWGRWLEEAKAPPIESVREVYRAARRNGVDVIYITGRPESARAGTERNLLAIDCADHVALICKPNDEKGPSAAYKTAARQRLAAEGRTIIANIGDQESDLVGGFAERTFKLPNPFYLAQ
ncbi:MAG: acid phosphatase [Opitutus sp.]|nr:acid phosphatase [Opitutus sp.]